MNKTMPTWRLEVEYEGTRYAGWQRQPNARTVQGELEKAAAEVFKSRVEVGGAGRTDAGVHALGQVAHLRVRGEAKTMAPARVEAGLNALLPHDINVSACAPRPRIQRAARRSRALSLQIATRARPSARLTWGSKTSGRGRDALAAAHVVGGTTSARSARAGAKTSTLVRVETSQVFTSGSLILFRVGASHFLWKMVRRLVGALVEVGRGNLTPEEFRRLLKTHSREPAAWTAPPSGLFLDRVLYPGDPPPTRKEPAFPVRGSQKFRQ